MIEESGLGVARGRIQTGHLRNGLECEGMPDPEGVPKHGVRS